jgi:hypothetical protein
MTEAEWLACESPVALLNSLNADGYSRKLLLYSSALCSRRADLLTQTLHYWSVAVEEVLLGVTPPSSLDDIGESAAEVCSWQTERGSLETRAYHAILYHVVACQWLNDPRELDVNFVLPLDANLTSLRKLAASFVRDIYGNPFRPVAFPPSWRTDTAIALARQIYESRDFSAMPILADALQDAGCDNDDVLNHCRGDGPHVRGCWVVDLVLEKE